MGTLTHLPNASKTPRVTATEENGAIVVRVEAAPVQAPDELRPIAYWAKEWGLERKGLESAIREANVAPVKIGRQLCVRRSDVVGLVDRLPAPKKAKPNAGAATVDAASAYAEIVATGTGGRRGRR